MVRGWAFLLFCFFSSAILEVQYWNDDNFAANLKSSGAAFVKFFAPWCGHCKRLAPTWDSLAEKVGGLVPIVKVDCTDVGKKLCSEYSVKGYPTLIFIAHNGDGSAADNKIESYNGARDIKSLLMFLTTKMAPAYVEVEASEAKKFVEDPESFVFLAVVESNNSELLISLQEVASSYRSYAKVGYVVRDGSAPVLDLPSGDRIVCYRPDSFTGREDPKTAMETNPKNVKNFFVSSIIGKVYFRHPTHDDLVDKPLLTVFIDKDKERDLSRFKMTRSQLYDAAKEFEDVVFSVASSSNYGGFLEDIGKDSFPEEYLVTYYESDEKKYVMEQLVGFADVKSLSTKVLDFLRAVKDGKVPVYIKSEPIPSQAELSKPVYKVVGKTFNDVVNNEEKDVFIAFVASWCGHCKQLEPIFDELGEKLKDEKNLVIARMDANENTVPKPFVVKGFPTLYLAVKGKKDKPIAYSGARTVDAMIDWLRDRVSTPLTTVQDEL